jgi:hypothetical protein
MVMDESRQRRFGTRRGPSGLASVLEHRHGQPGAREMDRPDEPGAPTAHNHDPRVTHHIAAPIIRLPLTRRERSTPGAPFQQYRALWSV